MEDTLEYIRSKINNIEPRIGLILGSGLGDFASTDVNSVVIPYDEIPLFEKSKVEGHKGQLVFSNIDGKDIVIMQGRSHYYEGYTMQRIVYPIKVLRKLGVKKLIITNAAGIINKDFKPMDLMLITDHINFMGTNPLIGENDPDLGKRFPDMSEIYSKKAIEKAEKIAERIGIEIKKGIYAASTGPSYETPAEIRMFKIAGADAAGMSTVPEAITANWCGMEILGISCLTNYAAGISSNQLSHNEVIETADKIKISFNKFLKELIKEA